VEDGRRACLMLRSSGRRSRALVGAEHMPTALLVGLVRIPTSILSGLEYSFSVSFLFTGFLKFVWGHVLIEKSHITPPDTRRMPKATRQSTASHIMPCRSNASWTGERYTRAATGMLAWRLTGSTGDALGGSPFYPATIEHF